MKSASKNTEPQFYSTEAPERPPSSEADPPRQPGKTFSDPPPAHHPPTRPPLLPASLASPPTSFTKGGPEIY